MYLLVRQEPDCEIVGLTSEILDQVTQGKDVPELHDRIIVATARYYSAGILTKDRIILGSGDIQPT